MTVLTTRDQVPHISRPLPPSMGSRPRAQQAGGLTGLDFLRILRKRKWLIVLSTVIFLVLGGVVHMLWATYSPTFTATAYLVVNPPEMSSDLNRTNGDGSIIDRFKLTVAQLAKSEAVLQQTLDDPRVKATSWYRQNFEKLLPRLSEDTKVAALPNTTLLLLSMNGNNPLELAEIVNAWSEAFVDDSLKSANRERTQRIERLQKEQEGLKRQLDLTAAEIAALRIPDAPVISQKLTMLTSEIAALNSQLAELNLARISAEQALRTFEDQKAKGMLAGSPQVADALEYDPLLKGLVLQLVGYNTQLDSLAAKVGPQNKAYLDTLIAITSLKKQIAERENQLREGRILVLADNYQRQVTEINSKQLSVQEKIIANNKKADQLQNNLAILEQLVDKQHQTEGSINLFDRTLLELRLQNKGAHPVFLRRPAARPDEPSWPKVYVLVPVGFLLGLVIGVGLAILLEVVDTTIKSPSDLSRRIDLPLLGMIPHTGDLEEEIRDLRLAFMTNPNSLVCEQFRQIRTCLQFSAPAAQLRSILITSGLPGDGRGTVTLNLAAALAHSGKKVLVVDANVRQPSIRRLFPECPEAGLSNTLVGQADWKALTLEIEPNLSVMSSGPLPPNPAELLGSEPMRNVLAEMMAAYDHVLFDGAPALLVSDPGVLSTIVDGVVLVVRAGSNSFGVVQRTKEVFNRIGAHMLGVVLNGVRVTAGGYLRKSYRTFYEYHELREKASPKPQAEITKPAGPPAAE